MRKEDKVAIIAQLGETLQQYPHFYLVDVEGMNAASTSALRRKCFQNNIKMVVVKNLIVKMDVVLVRIMKKFYWILDF